LSAGPGHTLFVSAQPGGVVQMSLRGKILRRSQPTTAVMLARTTDGRFWMSGSEIAGITLGGHRLNLEPANVPEPHGGGMEIEADRAGGFWACYSAGLIHKDDAGSHLISKKNGLLGNRCVSFAIEPEGDIWYSYNPAGTDFSLIENPKGMNPHIRHFASGGEVGNIQNNFFASDRRGWLWRGTPSGIYVADPEQARRGQWLYLNRTDGLPGIDANQRSFFNDADGSVWFGMDNSVIHLFPSDDLIHPRYAPAVFVSGGVAIRGTRSSGW